jgi:hypothetical protein
MKRPMTADQAQDLLYDVYGDDDLYDSLDELQDVNPKSDARDVIIKHLNQSLIDDNEPNHPKEVERGYFEGLRKIVTDYSKRSRR